MFDIDLTDLKAARSKAEANLYKALRAAVDIEQSFNGR